MSITVHGSLVSESIQSFTGYRAAAIYEVPVGDPTQPLATVTERRVALTDAQGRFTLEVPSADDRSGPVRLRVTGPSGLVLAEQAPAGDDALTKPIEITVQDDVTPTTVTLAPDITLGSQITYHGRVIDVSGNAAPPGLLVVLWGVPLGRDSMDAYPLDVQATSGGGYLSGPWPQDTITAAFATVDGSEPVAVAVEDGRFPRRFVVVLSQLPQPHVHDDTPCSCEGPPRAPEATDLVEDAGTYAADHGRCVDFTVPNRTLEEVAFQAVVRTTQPELKGTPPPRLPQIPPEVLGHLADLARTNVALALNEPTSAPSAPMLLRALPSGTGESTGPPRSTSTPITTPDGPGETVRRLAGDVVSRVATERARMLLGGIDLDRAGAGFEAPARVAEAVLERRDLTAQPMRLEPSVLSELVRESTNLTPLRLLEAEQASVIRHFRGQVGLLATPNPARYVLGDRHQVNWDDLPLASQTTTIAHGHLLTFKQVWKADGYSLGDLLYSLPLAPGQQKLISVLDWERREIDTRQATRRLTEQVSADLRRDRDISDIVRASLSEQLDASSAATVSAVGGGIGGFIGPLVFGAAGGVSSASSTARQTSGRQVTGSALNQVRDRTLQAASAVRGQRSTVVQTARQGEAVRAQTEVVANYNHCHAMTVEYFEVLRHFQVRQELAQVQECLFVPFAITPFSRSKSLRWRQPLERALLRRDLWGAFAALERVATNWADADVPLGRYADEVVRHVDSECWIRMRLPRPADTASGGFDASTWASWAPWLWDTAQAIWERYLGVVTAERRDSVWDRHIAPGIAQRLVNALRLQLVSTSNATANVTIDTTMVSAFAQDRSLLVGLRTDSSTLPSWTRAQIGTVRLQAPAGFPGAGVVVVDAATFRYRTDHLSHTLVANHRAPNDLGVGDDADFLAPLDALEKRNPRERDRQRCEDLLDHLDEHIDYYHRSIWLDMDPNRRYLLLDGFVAPDAGGRSVASVVENRIIGIVGNSLVMPVMPGMRLDSTYEFAESTPDDLRHLYAGASAPPMRVSTPTKGVFAEAVMGRCNSCEVIDDTRFWRFEDEPIPDRPTPIEALSTESRRRQPPSMAPDQFPEPLVRMQAAPSAPDPTGLAAALKALGTTGIFRDVTGLVLNQANSAQALKTAVSTAQTFAKQAGALAQQQYLNRELDRSLARIKDARNRDLIGKEDAQQLAESALRGAIGEARPKSEPATKAAPVQRAIERVNSAAGGGSLRVTRPEGTVEVRTGDSATMLIETAVDPPVAPVQQPSRNVCWAAAGTMMLSWKKRTSMTIEAALQSLGGGWLAKMQQGDAVTLGELRGFTRALGLTEQAPMSYTPQGLARLLDTNGPLWMVTDDDVEGNAYSHARILTAMRGDGTAEGTTVALADSATGMLESEPFVDLARRLEASDPVDFGAGIFHF